MVMSARVLARDLCAESYLELGLERLLEVLGVAGQEHTIHLVLFVCRDDRKVGEDRIAETLAGLCEEVCCSCGGRHADVVSGPLLMSKDETSNIVRSNVRESFGCSRYQDWQVLGRRQARADS